MLTLPLPSLLVPTPFTKAGGGGGGGGGERTPSSAISETVARMNVKFYRVSETPSEVFEMLKLFT